MKKLPAFVEVSEATWSQVRMTADGATLRHKSAAGRSTLSVRGETIARRLWPTAQGFPGRFEVRSDYLPEVAR